MHLIRNINLLPVHIFPFSLLYIPANVYISVCKSSSPSTAIFSLCVSLRVNSRSSCQHRALSVRMLAGCGSLLRHAIHIPAVCLMTLGYYDGSFRNFFYASAKMYSRFQTCSTLSEKETTDV